MATVPQLLASMRSADDIETAFQQGLRQLREIDAQLDQLVAVARPEDHPEGHDDWKLVYQAIFSVDEQDFAPRARRALDLAGFGFPSYHDPDTTYEDDVRAWIAALKEVLVRVEAHGARQAP